MTKTKKATELARTTSAFQKKLNLMKNQARRYHNALERRMKQIRMDSEFAKKVREKNPELYWEVVKEITKQGIQS